MNNSSESSLNPNILFTLQTKLKQFIKTFYFELWKYHRQCKRFGDSDEGRSSESSFEMISSRVIANLERSELDESGESSNSVSESLSFTNLE